ncbi:hypothetical protein [Pseudosporangium ferrugineum]|uniref:Uncharacterized protein n=1 Tax=Pseudosporangium ferrugineum TaxID=439699 RepID=A0A2T0RS74_9ACTN|nr:hypothetical protein [Pseudosporangium ferrugineum]PRY24055.1 hypothetical protein CLV70_114188 [Pseudosporangium ferrugineum]
MVFVREVFERHFSASWAKYQEALAVWQADRIATASGLLGIPAAEVHGGHIVWCHMEHGVPPLEDEAPKITDFPMDGRLRRAVERW